MLGNILIVPQGFQKVLQGFQKILQERKVTVMTTPTIMSQFLRKYSLISGLTDGFLFRLFVFLPVRIGEPAHFQGGTLAFFYALHALPCVGAPLPPARGPPV